MGWCAWGCLSVGLMRIGLLRLRGGRMCVGLRECGDGVRAIPRRG